MCQITCRVVSVHIIGSVSFACVVGCWPVVGHWGWGDAFLVGCWCAGGPFGRVGGVRHTPLSSSVLRDLTVCAQESSTFPAETGADCWVLEHDLKRKSLPCLFLPFPAENPEAPDTGLNDASLLFHQAPYVMTFIISHVNFE